MREHEGWVPCPGTTIEIEGERYEVVAIRRPDDSTMEVTIRGREGRPIRFTGIKLTGFGVSGGGNHG